MTELQESLVKVMKGLNVPFSVALPTMLRLETEEEELELARFFLDNRGRELREGEIVNKVSEILSTRP